MSTTVEGVVGTIVLAVLLVFIIAVLVAFPTMWLWNWLMPQIFGLTTITLMQAFGLNLLTGILFGGRSTSKSK